MPSIPAGCRRRWAVRARRMISSRDISRRPGSRAATTPAAKVSGGYWHHRERQKPAAAVARSEFSGSSSSRSAGRAHRRHAPLSGDVDVVIVGGGAAGVGAARRLAQTGLTRPCCSKRAPRLGGRACTHEIAGLAARPRLRLAAFRRSQRLGRASPRPPAFRSTETKAPWGNQYPRPRVFRRRSRRRRGGAFDAWMQRLVHAPPASDCAADALDPGTGSGTTTSAPSSASSAARRPERLSIADYLAYDEASAENNWRLRSGYGALVASAFPRRSRSSWRRPSSRSRSTPTASRSTRARRRPRARRDPHGLHRRARRRHARSFPPSSIRGGKPRGSCRSGCNEKLFLEIHGRRAFRERNARHRQSAGSAHRVLLHPAAWFAGDRVLLRRGARARLCEEAASPRVSTSRIEQLSALFGSGVRRRCGRWPASSWSQHAAHRRRLQLCAAGQVAARTALAQPFDDRVFFAGEATSSGDFSTAHGAHDSGVRAADEAIAALSRR